MNDFNFILFKQHLRNALLKIDIDNVSRIETYVDCLDKEYKIIIETVKQKEGGR